MVCSIEPCLANQLSVSGTKFGQGMLLKSTIKQWANGQK